MYLTPPFFTYAGSGVGIVSAEGDAPPTVYQYGVKVFGRVGSGAGDRIRPAPAAAGAYADNHRTLAGDAVHKCPRSSANVTFRSAHVAASATTSDRSLRYGSARRST